MLILKSWELDVSRRHFGTCISIPLSRLRNQFILLAHRYETKDINAQHACFNRYRETPMGATK